VFFILFVATFVALIVVSAGWFRAAKERDVFVLLTESMVQAGARCISSYTEEVKKWKQWRDDIEEYIKSNPVCIE